MVTDEQSFYLRTLLWRNVKYQETYDEIYDHVITALESQAIINLSFDALVFKIISEDFGGFSTIRQKEKERSVVLIDTILNKMNARFLEYFCTRHLLVSAALYGFILWVIVNQPFFLLSMLLYTTILTPLGIICIHHLYNIATSGKPSIKFLAIKHLALSFIGVLFIDFFHGGYKPYKLEKLIVPGIWSLVLSGILTTCMVFVICFVKAYREELQIKLV
jgi:hypothetical protein